MMKIVVRSERLGECLRRGAQNLAVLGGVALVAGCTTVMQPSAGADRKADATSNTVSSRAQVSSLDPSPPDPDRFLQAFPPAAAGQTRWVIALPARAHEDQFKVELLPSIRMRTDCNNHLGSAQVEMHTVPGWGYAYQVMGEIGPVVATLMGCPADATRDRDVPVNTALPLQRYNSRVPMVFYTPAQVTLRYRLWRGEDAIQAAVPSN